MLALLGLFPAHAGMNRVDDISERDGGSVPRTRGDEPHIGACGNFRTPCSPHTRG